jgi:chromosome segregation ATPase
MEARIARLESDVGHLREDVTEIKMDLRALRDKLDDVGGQLNEKIDGVAGQLNGKIENVKDSIASVKIWALTLYITFAAVMLGTLARGFGWI